jgi:Xaa-Pro aminopeptidase
MVLAIEPRIVVDDRYAIGLEDMVLVREADGESLNSFEKASLDL